MKYESQLTANQQHVLAFLRLGGARHPYGIAQATGLKEETVRSIVKRLVQLGFVVPAGSEAQPHGGPDRTLYAAVTA